LFLSWVVDLMRCTLAELDLLGSSGLGWVCGPLLVEISLLQKHSSEFLV
jgi:hypothetical protein